MKNLLIWRSALHRYGLTDKIILLLIFIAIVATFAEMVGIGIFLPLFEVINPNNNVSNENDIINHITYFYSSVGLDLTIEILLISTFLVFLFTKLILFIGNYIQSYYSGLILKKMRDKIMRLYLNAPPQYYDQVSIGDITNRITVELSSASNGVMIPIKFLITVISAIGVFIMLMLLSYKLTLLTIFVILINILLPVRWVKATTNAGRKNSRYNSVITTFLLNRLQSPRLVRLSGTTAMEHKSFSTLTERQRKLTLVLHLLKARVDLFIEPIIIGVSLLMLYIALEVLSISFSIVMLYLVVMIRSIPIVKNVMTQLQSINRAKGPIESVDKIFNSMQKMVDERELRNNTLINSINELQEITLENIYFKYEQSNISTLSKINLNFKKNTITAIVGPSGSGKSTLVDLISCFRCPLKGSVRINGVDSKHYSHIFFSKFVSFVPQTPQLFDGSIFSHISYGKKDTTDGKVINAAKLSGAYDFIVKLPNGFDYMLNDGASNLSGGQKQRIDLARALLRDAPLLIFDEPTTGLDTESEIFFNRTIDNIRNTTNKIIIVISHKISHIAHYDKIIVLQDGIVTGFGNHNELLSNNDWYKKTNSQ